MRRLNSIATVLLLAAACTAVASVVLVVGHLLSTSTFDILAWTVVTWLVARILRTDEQRLWPTAGLVAKLFGYSGMEAPVNVSELTLIPFWLYAVEIRICGTRP